MGFSTVFAQLRRENRYSQRKVAADLAISQALLSHYENGLREPKLDFVVRASEYYGVSADYMLGRTAVKENPMLTGVGFSGESDGELADLWTNGNIYNLFNAVTVIMNMLINVFGDKAADGVFKYFSVAAYNIFRFMRLDTDEDLKKLLSIPGYKFGIMCDGAAKNIESRLADLVNEGADRLNEDYTAKIKDEFPSAYGMFIDWLKCEDAAVNALNDPK